jgi:hypothetical protein
MRKSTVVALRVGLWAAAAWLSVKVVALLV